MITSKVSPLSIATYVLCIFIQFDGKASTLYIRDIAGKSDLILIMSISVNIFAISSLTCNTYCGIGAGFYKIFLTIYFSLKQCWI